MKSNCKANLYSQTQTNVPVRQSCTEVPGECHTCYTPCILVEDDAHVVPPGVETGQRQLAPPVLIPAQIHDAIRPERTDGQYLDVMSAETVRR